MSNKFPRFTTPAGVAVQWPKVTRPDTKFDADGVYSLKLAFDPEDIEDLTQELVAVRDEFLSTLPPAKARKVTIADVTDAEEDDDGEETGRAILKTKLKAKVTSKKTGESWDQRPRIFDAQGRDITDTGDIRIGSGSVLKANIEAVPYLMESTRTVGVSLRLRAVQVIKLVEGGGAGASSYGFGSEDGYTAPATAAGFAAADDTDEDDEDF